MRSRTALLALGDLLLDEPRADELSVTEVASRAGVSRPTFYQHFADVPTLIAAAVIAELDSSFARSDVELKDLTGIDFLRGTNRMLLERVHARRAVIRRVIQGSGSYAVISAAVGYISTRMRDHVLGTQLSATAGANSDDRITAIAAGSTWLVLQWLESDFTGRNSPEMFTERLTDLMLALAGTPHTSRN